MSFSGKKTSPVWDFFEVLEDDPMKARCKLCSNIVSRGGIGRKATTSGLNNHLKTKHPHQLKEIKRCQSEESSVVDTDQDSQAQSSSRGIKRKQQSLEACLERKKLWDINDVRSVKLHYAIGEMIAIDNQPFSIVNDIGFKKLMLKAQPQYQIPGRNYFTDYIIPDLYSKCKQKISLQIETAEAISVTSDIWSSINNYSFISFTAHWITSDFERKSAALNVKHLPGSHTGENIRDMLKELITDWNVANKLHILIRDNGANMVKAVRDSDIKSASCFIHTLQLVINDGIESQRVVKDIISYSRKIVTHFNHSPLACSNLEKIQVEELNVAPKKLIQDISTRWNSTFYMLERLVEQKKAISLFSTEYGGINSLKADQWSTIEAILRLLQPFEEITKIISTEASVISEVIPTVSTLKRYLSKNGSEFFGVGTMKDTLQTGLEKRFSDIYKNEFYLLATLLDPRFKSAFFINDDGDAIEAAKSALNEKMDEINVTMTSNMDIASKKDTDNSLPQKIHTSFWQCFTDIAQGPETTSNIHTNFNTSMQTSNSTELNLYLSLPLIPRENNPLVWWKENQISMPTLAKIAKKYLSAPASSIASERLFSEAGNIYEKKRNRLQPDNAERLIFLHHNLLNFDCNE